MDFSQLNSAEQAHMTKIIEKKQVCILAYSLLQTFSRFLPDARLPAFVLGPRGKMLYLML